MFRFLLISTLASFQFINGNAAISMMTDNEPTSLFKRRSVRTSASTDSEDSKVQRAGPSSSSLSKAVEPMSTDDLKTATSFSTKSKFSSSSSPRVAEPMTVDEVKASTTTSSKFPIRSAVKTSDDADADAVPVVRKPFSSSSSSLRGSATSGAAEPMSTDAIKAANGDVSPRPKSKSGYSFISSKSMSAAEPLDLSTTKSSTTSSSSKFGSSSSPSIDASPSVSRVRSADDESDLKVQKMITIGRAQGSYIETLKGYLQLLKDTRESKADDKDIDTVQEKLKKAYQDQIKDLEENMDLMNKLK